MQLEDGAVAGLQVGIGDVEVGGGALDHDGGLAGDDAGVGDGHGSVLVADDKHAVAVAGDLAAVDDLGAGGADHAAHQQRIAVDMDIAVVEADDIAVADAEGTVAHRTGAGQLHVAVLDKDIGGVIAAVNGEHAPAVGLEVAVGVVHGAVVAQLHQAVGAGDGNAPAEVAHPVGVIGAAVLDAAVIHMDNAVAADVHGAAGDTVHGELTVLNGQMHIVNGGNAGAGADKVVVTVAVQINVGVGDHIVAVAGDQNAVEILLIAGDGHADGLIAGDHAALHQSGHALGLDDLIVGDHGGSAELLAAAHHQHQAVGIHMIILRHGEHDITIISAGLQLMANTVHSQLDKLALGSGQLGSLLQRQLAQLGSFLQQLNAVHDHLAHIIILLNLICETSSQKPLFSILQ